jgi:cell division GTPase FtsZ
MKALLIGCGQGGSRLTEAIMKIQCATFGVDETNHSVKKQFEALIVNTTEADIEKIDRTYIHEDHRLVIGSGYSPTSGRGAGGDPRLGTQAANHDIYRIEASIEEALKRVNLNPNMGEVDAIVIISALGGGSGSGMGPVIAKLLKEKFKDQYPVLGIVSLPAKDEGHLNSYNAYMSIQSWLKESNFEGIITMALGGKSLRPSEDSQQYFSRFNKSFAKALYILFGGNTMGEGSKTVDVADILATIRDGGGICTLGHLSCHLSEAGNETSAPDCPLYTGNLSTGKVAGSEVKPLLDKVRDVCYSRLFLPEVDITKARTGLLVIKDSKKFKVTQNAGSAAANCVADMIGGYVRYSGLTHTSFRLITDNSNGKVFEDYEISDEDEAFSRNETVEIALLLSGISDVKMIKDLAGMADKVIRFTRPPRGERLLADTFGIPIGVKIDSTVFLPCSNLRDNIEAQIQSKATNAGLDRFVSELMELNHGLTALEKIKKGIKVTDVKPVPDLVICDTSPDKRIHHTCYEIDLVSDDLTDNTRFKKKMVIRVQGNETEKNGRSAQRATITWQPPEILQDMPGWSEDEQTIADEMLQEARRQFSDAVICGIGHYPSIEGLVKKYVKRARIITKVPSGKYEYRYYYRIDAHPRPIVLSQDVMNTVQASSDKNGYKKFWNIILEKETDLPSEEKIHELLRTMGINLSGGE